MRMSSIKKIVAAIVIVFIAIQFIQPGRNKSDQLLAADITKTVGLPENVKAVFKKSCNDCHSNNTSYPMYVNIQPLGWLMANHVKNGKENLNFSEFGTYSKRKQFNKLRAIATSIKDGSMPLESYTMMHNDARLSKENKETIINWISKIKDSLSAGN